MKKTVLALTIATLSFNALSDSNPIGFPSNDPAVVYQQMDLENVTSAFVDLQPEAAFMALHNSYLEAGSSAQHIGIMETSVDPRQTVLTGNSETVYAVHAVNLNEQGGAVVLEVPAGVMGAANAAGWIPVTDFGLLGPDQGQGGTYLLTSPDWEGEVPEGMFHAPSSTNTVNWIIRGFQKEDGMAGAVKELQAGIKTYSLDNIDNPGETTFYNTSAPVYDNGGYQDMLFQAEDMPKLIKMHYELNGHGAVKHSHNTANLHHAGFFDGTIDQALLDQAISTAWERVLTMTFNNRDQNAFKWEDNHWALPNTSKDENWTHRHLDIIDPVAQTTWSHQATFTSIAMARPPEGAGAVYVNGSKDSNGEFLNGSNCYELTIPADVPYANFWSLVTYEAQERSMIRNSHHKWAVNSYMDGLEPNTDGSYTITWGPNVANEVNTIQTNEGEGFFSYFRIYGPKAAWYDNTWVLPNIEKINCN
ncbi:conserved exported hypothetical protein [Vibrio chagasii]|uniref:DUF1214 domain-containing protein n=1 Tax=Vibrio chagasii TaxID=170679 RepID=UPI00337A8FE8|nr:conserved exported hypothetical protein [Vibrio chagasii]CAH6935589.1 conserved exported hypothetical protein [Vibrio chagasii]CAH7051888.1 conserved exported hypothetical protein [Vibrio chagasii]CAH7063391.1 conserved exported hypothetical protein [Vibrio chagasii]CAH7133153.1 conserved exported hypothetical protein [Vibrio chagasii]